MREKICKRKYRLKFCPFCGGFPTIEYVRLKWYERLGCSPAFSRTHDVRVKCKFCRATTDRFISEEMAVMCWNKRSGAI